MNVWVLVGAHTASVRGDASLNGEEHGGALKNLRGIRFRRLIKTVAQGAGIRGGGKVANPEKKEGRSRRRNPNIFFHDTCCAITAITFASSLKSPGGMCSPRLMAPCLEHLAQLRRFARFEILGNSETSGVRCPQETGFAGDQGNIRDRVGDTCRPGLTQRPAQRHITN